MADIPVHEMANAITVLRFTRVSAFHKGTYHFPIQWHDSDQRDEAFRLYNTYSGWCFEPQKGLEYAADEHVFNWLLWQATMDLVMAHDAHSKAVAQGFQTGQN